jgi:hypothetical protein
MEFTTEELKTWLEATKRAGDVSSYYGQGEWGGYKIAEKDGELYAVPYTYDDETGQTEWSGFWDGPNLVRGRHRIYRVVKQTRVVEEAYYVNLETGEDLDP